MDTTLGAPWVHTHTHTHTHTHLHTLTLIYTHKLQYSAPLLSHTHTHTHQLNKLQSEHTHRSASHPLTRSLSCSKVGCFPYTLYTTHAGTICSLSLSLTHSHTHTHTRTHAHTHTHISPTWESPAAKNMWLWELGKTATGE